jgi:hypothetical protein
VIHDIERESWWKEFNSLRAAQQPIGLRGNELMFEYGKMTILTYACVGGETGKIKYI